MEGEKANTLDLQSEEVQAFIKLLADKQILIYLTVSTFRSLLIREDKKIDQEFAAVAEHLPPAIVRRLKGAEMKIPADRWPAYLASADALLKMIKLLYDSGVPMVPGTDNMAGFTLQRELELYAKAGIPNIEVQKMASLQCAKVVGMAHQSGSIAVGKQVSRSFNFHFK